MNDVVARLLDGNDAMNNSSYSAEYNEEEGDFANRSSNEEGGSGYAAEPPSKKAKMREPTEFASHRPGDPFAQTSLPAASDHVGIVRVVVAVVDFLRSIYLSL
jgi:hypothetical protein